MLKLIGGILVAGSGVGLAVNMIAEIRQHLLRLYEIRQLLINISGEAALALLPMEHILNQPTLTNDVVLQKVCGQIADRLAAKKGESGGEIWWDIFWKNRKELGICASELEIIANAGNAFFGRNIKENERMLSIYLERLDFVIEQERKEQREKQRVAGAVSVIGGLGFGLAMNEKALGQFSMMTEDEKRQVIDAARGAQTKEQMAQIVKDIADMEFF